MRLKSPRIEPLDLDRLDEAQREVLAPFAHPDNKVGGGKVLNIFRTLAHSPKALTGFLAWGNYVLSRRNSLGARERELGILRTGWNCRSGYEFAQHKRIGLVCGLSEQEIEDTIAWFQALWPPEVYDRWQRANATSNSRSSGS